MSALSIQPTYPIFTDIDGQPLEAGYVWIGQDNLDPQVNPINVFWDAALTIPAVQPIRTLGGYPSNSGTPARLYVNSNYSIRVMNKNGSVVYSAPSATERISGVVISGDIDASDVNFLQQGVGAVVRTVQEELEDTLKAQQFGVVGDGLVDDWPAFQLAVNAAKTQNKILDISDLKIYLASQNASIDCDGLFILGNGYITTYVDYLYQAGGDYFDNHKAAAIPKVGSVIFSRYGGPIFTGKTFNGKGFSVFGDMTSAGSNGFVQTTPTSYPGWSQALVKCTSVYFANFNQDGIHLLGGLEVCNVIDVHTFQVGGWGFRVSTTPGINCPVEYLVIRDGSFQWSYWNNINLNGANKHITIENNLLNAPQQLSRLLASGFSINNYSDIVPCIYINSPNNANGSFNFNIINNYAEQTNGFLTLNCDVPFRQQGVTVMGNTMYIDQVGGAPYYTIQFLAIQYDFKSYQNPTPQGTVYYFPGSVINASCQYMNFLDESTIFPTQILIGAGAVNLYEQQMVPTAKWPTSCGLGSGGAGTVSFNLPTIASPGNDNQLFSYLYLVTANFQANSGNGFGAYLVTITRMSSGDYVGTSIPFGSTTGFTAPPTVTAAGVLEIPLAVFYRARVSRIDSLPIDVGYPVNLP